MRRSRRGRSPSSSRRASRRSSTWPPSTWRCARTAGQPRSTRPSRSGGSTTPQSFTLSCRTPAAMRSERSRTRVAGAPVCVTVSNFLCANTRSRGPLRLQQALITLIPLIWLTLQYVLAKMSPKTPTASVRLSTGSHRCGKTKKHVRPLSKDALLPHLVTHRINTPTVPRPGVPAAHGQSSSSEELAIARPGTLFFFRRIRLPSPLP